MSSRNRNRRPPAKPAGAQSAQTFDSFQNFLTRTGMGAGSQNDGAGYGFNPVSRNRTQLEFAYRSSWIIGQVVDTVADDMTREGAEIHADIAPDVIEKIEREATRIDIWGSLCSTIKWARLFGGAIGLLMVDGQKADTELRMDSVAKGQFRGILPLDRWLLQPVADQLITELGPDLGKPKFYETVADNSGIPAMRIHHSRVIRLDGVDLPHYQRLAENGWGQSVVERLWDRIIPFDSATAGAAQLVYKAHLRTYKVKGLREIIAVGGPAMKALVEQMNMVRQYQNNEGLTLMDADDEFEAHSYTFSGLDSVLLQFGQQISGATQIPLVRLFGQSPAGLNSTGESDIRTYYDGIKQQQERRIGTGVEKAYNLLHRSVTGEAPPEGWEVKFKSLWQMSDDQKADVTTKNTTAVVGAYEAQIISRATALKELRQLSKITGTFSNISDEEIKESEDDPPPGAMNEEGLPDARTDPDTGSPPANESEGGADQNGKSGADLREKP